MHGGELLCPRKAVLTALLYVFVCWTMALPYSNFCQQEVSPVMSYDDTDSQNFAILLVTRFVGVPVRINALCSEYA